MADADPPVRDQRGLRRWVFLDGDRRALTVVLLAVIFGALLLVGTVWEFEMERLVTETRAVQTLFNTLLGGIILFVSVVLSINTAALTREFASLQVKRSRIEDAIDFQVELEELGDEGVSPAGLKPFLEYVVSAVRSETAALRRGDEAGPGGGAIASFASEVEAELSLVEDRIRGPHSPVSVVLLSCLDYPYARHINRARRLRVAHGDELTADDRASLDALLQALTIFASGREYFTTLYFKRELRDLSSALLILSLPVIVFTAYVLLAIDAGLFPRLALKDIGARLLYVNLAFVVALSPYVLLSSYMLRLLTVSKHSLETTVFSLDVEGDSSP
jgi:hypothetical protein